MTSTVPAVGELREPSVVDALLRPRSVAMIGASRNPKALGDWYPRHLGIDPIPADYQHSPWARSRADSICTVPKGHGLFWIARTGWPHNCATQASR